MAGKRNKKKDYNFAVGRRRKASARVRLFRGKGEITVNGILIEKYFPGGIFKEIWSKPFQVTETSDKYFATIKVEGGGKKGQLEAVSHALAKVLAKENKEKFRPSLKKFGLLKRDARVRERRKVGMGGKARRKKQSPKR